MTQDNVNVLTMISVNAKLWDSQVNELKSITKNETDVTQRLSYMIDNFNETNFTHKWLITTMQVAFASFCKLLQIIYCQPFANNLLDNIKLPKTQI